MSGLVLVAALDRRGAIGRGNELPWRLPDDLKASWIWWGAPSPPARNTDLAVVLEPDDAVTWNPPERTHALLALMADSHREAVELRIRQGGRSVGAVFRRMRGGEQRAEVRFDMAGCLRTPGGGSSRQTLVIIENGRVRTRLMTARETARLMGLEDGYRLPASYSAACQLTGDGVAVPVVRHLARHLFEPLLGISQAERRAA